MTKPSVEAIISTAPRKLGSFAIHIAFSRGRAPLAGKEVSGKRGSRGFLTWQGIRRQSVPGALVFPDALPKVGPAPEDPRA